MEYRAFGGLKSMTYGNSTTRTQSYNARLQLATLQVGALLSADFEYHADGAIRYAKDNTDAVKDRAYRYDQAGRLSEGLSGAEARGLSVVDGVYRQSYQYDAWSNLTGRAVNRFWSGGEPFSISYVNNREPGATYDADGRVTRDTSGRTHVYDAAGRQTQTSEASQASSWAGGLLLSGASLSPLASKAWPSTPASEASLTISPTPASGRRPQPSAPAGGYYTTTTLTITESYDGDGSSLKRVERKVQSTPNYQPVITERVDYYLRSSVLEGKVITELDSAGQKTKTHVYAGSEEIAEQRLYNNGSQQSIWWQHLNPVTGTRFDGSLKKEYDPFGLELGDTDPYLQNAEPDYASMGGSFYRDGGNPFGAGSGGCQWNGMPVRCVMFESILRTQNVVDIQIGRNVDRSFTSSLHWVDSTNPRPNEPPADPDSFKTNIWARGGHWELLSFFASSPQNPQRGTDGYTGDENRIARLAIDQALEALASHPLCQDFFRGKLEVDPSDNLKAIDSHDGFKRGPRGFRGDVAWTALALGNRSVIYLYDPFFEESVGNTTSQFLPDKISKDQARALTILHEFAHAVWRTFHAGSLGGMSSGELDRKIFDDCFDGGHTPLPKGVGE
jgi:hypothetical protein